VAGILHSTGLLRAAGDISAMEIHVGAAIAAVPLGIWHVLARRIPARAADLSRRSLLRAGRLLAAAGLTYAASEALVRVAGLPGAGRRFTGSYEVASFQPGSMPVTQWMFDPVPRVDMAGWRLQVRSGARLREWRYDELAAFNDRVTATLDCTGGFYTTQHWTGVWLSRLLEPAGALSLRVRSQTGYDRRFPVEDLPRILLATRVGDSPLSAGNGFPVRLVATGRRGFWWVKWVSQIDADGIPAFWQPPFPLQ
jgi:DMSO/TMAO reductase YedYZ molybdopterin-dependent catalytic subunit